MGWSLSYLGLKEPKLLDEFFLAVGKALYLASAFERKCKWVLRVVKLTEHLEQNGEVSISAINAVAMAIKNKLLGPTLADMKKFPDDFTADDLALLERAIKARNFIAHECADIGPLSSASAKHILEQQERLRNEVEALTDGDNLISRWIYEIENREPAPWGFQEDYRTLVQQWIFAALHRT
jgi:hypothetical protein